MRPPVSVVIPFAALLLAACGGEHTTDVAVNNAAAAAFVPPSPQLPKPLPGQAHAEPLTAYVGHYPGDAVDGVGFYDRTEVARALNDAVGDERIRRRFVSRDAVTVPIVHTADGRLAAHGCVAHDCADTDWTFVLAPDGSHAEACYHDADTMGTRSRWFAPNRAPAMRAGDCPQEQG
jgi:hypothetical protein